MADLVISPKSSLIIIVVITNAGRNKCDQITKSGGCIHTLIFVECAKKVFAERNYSKTIYNKISSDLFGKKTQGKHKLL